MWISHSFAQSGRWDSTTWRANQVDVVGVMMGNRYCKHTAIHLLSRRQDGSCARARSSRFLHLLLYFFSIFYNYRSLRGVGHQSRISLSLWNFFIYLSFPSAFSVSNGRVRPCQIVASASIFMAYLASFTCFAWLTDESFTNESFSYFKIKRSATERPKKLMSFVILFQKVGSSREKVKKEQVAGKEKRFSLGLKSAGRWLPSQMLSWRFFWVFFLWTKEKLFRR